MAFNNFTYRVRVVNDRLGRDWVERNVKQGHWGKMINLSGFYSATYCFEFEEDALAFKLVHGAYEGS